MTTVEQQPLTSRERGYVAAVERRRDWLREQVKTGRPGVSFDRHELAALEWMLGVVRRATGETA